MFGVIRTFLEELRETKELLKNVIHFQKILDRRYIDHQQALSVLVAILDNQHKETIKDLNLVKKHQSDIIWKIYADKREVEEWNYKHNG